MKKKSKLVIKAKNLEDNKHHFHKVNIYYAVSLLFSYLFKPLNLSYYYRENFLPLFRLINRAFTKSLKLTFFAVWFPFIFILIVTNITSPQATLFSIGLMIPTIVGIQILPILLVQFKSSSLLKKIGATKIKTWMLTLSFILYFCFVSIVSIIFNVGLGIAMKYNDMVFGNPGLPVNFNPLHITQVVNWGQYIFSIILSLIISISVGMLIAGLVKSPSAVAVFGLFIVLIGGFLSGQFISFALINKVKALKYLGFFFPQKWPTILAIISTSGGNIFNLNDNTAGQIINWENIGKISSLLKAFPNIDHTKLLADYPVYSTIASKPVIILSYIIPWVVSASTFALTLKWFKWK